MTLLRRRKGGTAAKAESVDLDRLREFVGTRRGVEAYLEPQTTVTAYTLMLIAADGEWTRRRIGSPAAAHSFAKKHQIPIYDAAIVGYPQRMRDWTARQKAAGR